MLRSLSLRSRRRPRYGAQVCAIIAAVLLLLSVSVLHSRLGLDRRSQQPFTTTTSTSQLGLGLRNLEFGQDSTDDIDANPLLEDVESNNNNNSEKQEEDDRIDELDVIEEDESEEQSKFSNEEEILRGVEVEEEVVEDDNRNRRSSSSGHRPFGYYYDHVVGVTRRRAFDKHSSSSIDPWEDDDDDEEVDNFSSSTKSHEDSSKVAFGSDDQPVDEVVRYKLDGIMAIEDALLLKTTTATNHRHHRHRKVVASSSPLRQGWATWFEKKGDFLRRDRMFKSNLELLNPLNNPLLQDPDAVGLTYLTKGDKLMQKALLNDFLLKLPSVVKKKSLRRIANDEEDAIKKTTTTTNVNVVKDMPIRRNHVKGVERRTLDENASNSALDGDNLDTQQRHTKSDFSSHKYADGRRWGYFPGLYPYLSFSNFMDEFFSKGKCLMRVFMVWNSPPWMYSVRHQRGLESLLYHHPDACVLVFSETIELDFFEGFVKDGFKVAVAMPNLDELLRNTPTHVFASVWFEWRKTIFYPIHYSELVRLAALYKYGGLYLDSDMIVLKPLSSLNNFVGLEDHLAESSLNGALMAFRKNSLFLMECLKEFYSTYDDIQLRWNGADLLTRIGDRLLMEDDKSDELTEVKILPSFMFFPIGPHDIPRYFSTPANETEKEQDILFRKILDESYAFHFWNSITSALVPEPKSLVAKLLDHNCIYCLDVL